MPRGTIALLPEFVDISTVIPVPVRADRSKTGRAINVEMKCGTRTMFARRNSMKVTQVDKYLVEDGWHTNNNKVDDNNQHL